ncbi:nucleotide sugar dehydrogenase [Propionibacteriaceae bacterium Y1923]
MNQGIMQDGTKTVTVIGQGYVGLPMAREACLAGWKVYGLDKSTRVVHGLASGTSHVDDVSDPDVQRMLEVGYWPTTDPAVVAESSVVVVCVPTPLLDGGLPDLTYIRDAARDIGANLQRHQVIILESTTYPGTTEREFLPILEKSSGLTVSQDFFVAFSPERVDPGRKDYGIVNTPKLVGGVCGESTRVASAFYSSFIQTVVPMRGPREAETAKLLENTFRHVNIALVNEMAKFCHELGIDIWDVIRGASTKPFGFMPFTPGPGVGGHCIPIDPNYLSHEVRRALGYPFRFVELAQEVNNSMPAYVVQRLQDLLNDDGLALRGANVLLLGVTYKPNIADQRESPARPIARGLLAKGAEVSFHDPLVEHWHLSPSEELDRAPNLVAAIENAHAVVLLQAHDVYDVGEIAASSGIFLDTRGRAPEMRQRL